MTAEAAPLCSLSDLKEGAPLGVVRDGRRLVVCRKGDDVRALDGVCPHRGAPLDGGYVDGDRLVCPWHGWAFGLADGKFVGGPQTLATHAVAVRGGKVYLAASP